jgi:hypothetical protein
MKSGTRMRIQLLVLLRSVLRLELGLVRQPIDFRASCASCASVTSAHQRLLLLIHLLRLRLLRDWRQLLVYALFLSLAASSKEAEDGDGEEDEETDW